MLLLLSELMLVHLALVSVVQDAKFAQKPGSFMPRSFSLNWLKSWGFVWDTFVSIQFLFVPLEKHSWVYTAVPTPFPMKALSLCFWHICYLMSYFVVQVDSAVNTAEKWEQWECLFPLASKLASVLLMIFNFQGYHLFCVYEALET